MGDEETMDERRRMKEKDGSKKLEARSKQLAVGKYTEVRGKKPDKE